MTRQQTRPKQRAPIPETRLRRRRGARPFQVGSMMPSFEPPPRGRDIVPRRDAKYASLGAAAFDRVAFGAPAQHAAGQIRDVLEAGLLQDVGGLGRAAAGAAYRDDRPVMAQLGGALGQFAERDQDRVPDMPERPGEFLGLAHIEDLHRRGVLLQAVRVDLPYPGEAVAQRRPAGVSGNAAFGG